MSARDYRVETTRTWWALLGFSAALLGLFGVALTWLFVKGVGIWGINQPVGWGFAITNFVWWIGIGHAGTFISAILYLANQSWRTSISRFAETMTIFAVLCAGLFPLVHMGRPWFFYYMVPYPNTMGLWPQFRSPLVWDLFAVGTYLTISLLFWFLGLVPDFAQLRDGARSTFAQRAYGVFALGWNGSLRHWGHYKMVYLLLAGIATPLVISVHSIVGMDFAAANVPGWHSTIFPPYFVAGAIFSGFAMVLTLGLTLRRALGIYDLVTTRHLESCALMLLATGTLVQYGYFMEVFNAYLSGKWSEINMMENRFFGPYAFAAWTMIFCNVVAPQVLWFPRVRRSGTWLFVMSIVINIGMWFERYVIVVTSLSRDFLPSSWHVFRPTFWDFATLFGSLGLFLTLYVLAARFLPMVAMAEIREDQHKEAA